MRICRHFQVTIVTRHGPTKLASLPRSVRAIKREPGVTDSRHIGIAVGPGGTALTQ